MSYYCNGAKSIFSSISQYVGYTGDAYNLYKIFDALSNSSAFFSSPGASGDFLAGEASGAINDRAMSNLGMNQGAGGGNDDYLIDPKTKTAKVFRTNDDFDRIGTAGGTPSIVRKGSAAQTLKKQGYKISREFFGVGDGAFWGALGWLAGERIGAWIGGLIGKGISSVGVGAAERGYINLVSEERTTHIIAGDLSGGGHSWFGSLKSFKNGITGEKSMFPITWSEDKIMHAVSNVVVNNPWIQQTGRIGASTTIKGQPVKFVVDGVYQGVNIRVVTTSSDIITAFPIE